MDNPLDLVRSASDLARELADLAKPMLKEPLEEAGLLFRDQVSYWRLKNAVRLMKKAREVIEENDISPRNIPFATMIPILEMGGSVEDENLQDKWAALLSKAADENYSPNLVFLVAKVLGQLTPEGALTMDMLHQMSVDTQTGKRVRSIERHEDIIKHLGVSVEEYCAVLQYLESLNLVLPGDTLVDLSEIGLGDLYMKKVLISDLGELFIKYCDAGSKE